MIQIDDKDFGFADLSVRHKVIILFKKLQLEFWKYGSGKTLGWEHRNKARIGRTGTGGGLDIFHRGRMTKSSIKKSIEKHLNYQPSHLRYLIIRSQFE